MSARSLHERLIDDLVAHGARRRGFGVALRRLFRTPEDYASPYYEREDDDLHHLGVVPDAFVIDKRLAHVTAYEVEVGCPVSVHKLSRYHDLFWLIDEEEWIFHLVLVDRNGRHRDVDLLRSSMEADRGATVSDAELAESRKRMGIRAPGEAP